MSKFNIKTQELEFKHDASEIKLTKFNEFAKSLNHEKYLEVASWDIYYAPIKESDLDFEFMRLRLGGKPELTIKKKTDPNNNNSRIEIDVPLDPKATAAELEEVASAFCDQFGFVENFRLFKYCSIFFYEKTDLVYYISYNKEMKELGRFVEVEARKDVPQDSEEEAWRLVKELEAKLSIFGITPQTRTKKSQWERNKKSPT